MREIVQLRSDVNNLKEMVENLTILMNKRLMMELHEEAREISAGNFITEKEFENRHKVKIL